MLFRAHSLLSSLAIGLVASVLATWMAQPTDGASSLLSGEMLMRVCGVAWLSCFLVFALLTQRQSAPAPVTEEEYAELVPPPTLAATQGELYLDMLKRVLLNIPYWEQSYQIVLSRGETRRQPKLAGPRFSLADRVNGEDVSMNTLSMIGLQRLDSLQACVETLLAENIPGDLCETGVAKGGACILMRAVLRVREERTRRVLCCDSYSSGAQGAGSPLPALLFRPLFSLIALASRIPLVSWHRRLYATLMRLQHSFPVDPATVTDDTLASFLFFLRDGARFVRPTVPCTGTSVANVRSHFARLGLLDDQVVFVPGFFDKTLPTLPSQRLALLRLDGDLYASTRDALVHLYPRLSPGGFLLVDDYYSFVECRRAVDEYRAAHGITAELVRVDTASVLWRVEEAPGKKQAGRRQAKSPAKKR